MKISDPMHTEVTYGLDTIPRTIRCDTVGHNGNSDFGFETGFRKKAPGDKYLHGTVQEPEDWRKDSRNRQTG